MPTVTSAVSFFAVEEISKFASLVSSLKEEDAETGNFVAEIQSLLTEEKYEEAYDKFSKETSLLLTLDSKEYERVFNFLIALICQANPENLSQLVSNVITPVVESEQGDCHHKLRILDSHNAIRYDVFVAIVKVAAKNEELDHVTSQLDNIDRLVASWGVGVAEKRKLFLLISDILKESPLLYVYVPSRITFSRKRESFEFLLKALATYNGADQKALKAVQQLAAEAVKSAIRIPSVLNFEEVYRLDAVRALGNSPLLDLLKIFTEGSLKDYRAFTKKNASLVAKEGLNEEDNVRKMRVLSLASLASRHVDGEIPYSVIAGALEITDDSVEIWVIDGIRAGLLDAKMNQLTKTVVVRYVVMAEPH
ncbi:hypothetical protein HDU96_004746 [Phlyctochytrium bullatum]|nr:hypothetical protein HDU96_004746 [Phlyctochytrium bullatum]